MDPQKTPKILSYGEVRILLKDLFPVRPAIYWLDFSITTLAGWLAFYLAVSTPWTTPLPKLGWLALASVAFFRSLVFVHELAHVSSGDLPGFRSAWNALCGMLFFVPSYTYAPHAAHHVTATFSTKEDPEYLPMAHQRVWEHLIPFLIFPFVPFLLALRFLLLGPLSLIVGGGLREWLLTNASTLKMNPQFQWKDISPFDRRRSVRQDLWCVAWWAVFLALFSRTGYRLFLLDWYLLVWAVFVINHIRSWARHRYINFAGDRVSYESQLLDSVAVTGFSPLATAFMPIGLRYHSLHHMFPKLPYHSLGRGHRRLLEILPADHIYRMTVVPGFLRAVANLFRCARHSPAGISRFSSGDPILEGCNHIVHHRKTGIVVAHYGNNSLGEQAQERALDPEQFDELVSNGSIVRVSGANLVRYEPKTKMPTRSDDAVSGENSS